MQQDFRLITSKRHEHYELHDVRKPELFREQFPYSEVPRIVFDGALIPPDPP